MHLNANAIAFDPMSGEDSVIVALGFLPCDDK